MEYNNTLIKRQPKRMKRNKNQRFHGAAAVDDEGSAKNKTKNNYRDCSSSECELFVLGLFVYKPHNEMRRKENTLSVVRFFVVFEK
jgi:hypothetical protein